MVKIKQVKIRQIKIRRIKIRRLLRPVLFVGLLALLTGAASSAFGQSFTLTVNGNGLQPAAVDPGGFATANLSLAGVNGFSSPVALSCVVTGSQTPLPTCLVSPTPATPSQTVSLTVQSGTAPAGQYTITVSGTSGSETENAPALFLNVVNVAQDYTLTVSKPISPSSVTAGGGAQATVTITPISSYSGTVTLSCLSITPVVVASPTCGFQAADGSSSVVVTGAPATAVLTISTFGTTQTMARSWSPRIFYAFWLAVPGLALIGVSAGGKRSGRLLGMLMLLAVVGCLLMVPACGGSSSTTSNNSGNLVTPKNNYMFSLSGVDLLGVSPGNTITDPATVSLMVN